MEQRRPVKTRKQKRDDERKSSLSGAGDFSEFRKSQNVVAFHQDAARRFAQVIEAQSDEGLYGDDDDLGLELGPPPPLLPSFTTHNSHAAVHSRRTHRAPSPLDLNFVEHDQFLSTSTEWSGITAQPIIGGLVPKMPEQTHIADTPIELPSPKEREKRFPDLGHLYLKDPGNDPGEYAIDELDILQEENETLLEKLREAEKKCEEAEARERFLESQIASLGEGAFQETKVLQRKQEELSRREEALRVARQNRVGKEEVADLHSEIKNLRKVIVETTHKLQDIESEAKSLHTMTHRMILTHEEMEEVVLKRCWLARYWGLAVQYGICADIAGLKYEFWSAFAPLPFEFVISAGQKAKESFFNKGENNSNGWTKSCEDSDYVTEGNIETMLSVEMGLKEMASLKIEDAVMLSMAQQRRPKLVQDSNVAGDPTFVDSFELSKEESNDILFKEAWLTYFWKTARDRQVEDDIAEERLELWTNRIGQSPALQDAVDVERGLIELRKLGIQQQLWEASRTEIVSPSLIETHDAKYALDSENSSW